MRPTWLWASNLSMRRRDAQASSSVSPSMTASSPALAAERMTGLASDARSTRYGTTWTQGIGVGHGLAHMDWLHLFGLHKQMHAAKAVYLRVCQHHVSRRLNKQCP